MKQATLQFQTSNVLFEGSAVALWIDGLWVDPLDGALQLFRDVSVVARLEGSAVGLIARFLLCVQVDAMFLSDAIETRKKRTAFEKYTESSEVRGNGMRAVIIRMLYS